MPHQPLTAEQRDARWQEFCREVETYLNATPLERARMRVEDYLAAENGRKMRGRPQTMLERIDAVLRRAEERILLDDWLDDEQKEAAIERLLDAEIAISNRHMRRPTEYSEFHILDLRNRVKGIVRSACGDRRWRAA
jgi:hypothetical protein